MMNYEEMSDFEINRAVACRLDGNDLDIFCRPMFSIDCYFSIPGSSSVNWHRIGYESFNPCNNPTDAFPIIERNGIGMYKTPDGWTCSTSISYGNFENETTDANPLRAAMIVFLMMQERTCQKS